jgi:hypothetical protein
MGNKVGSVRITVTRSRNHCCHERKQKCIPLELLTDIFYRKQYKLTYVFTLSARYCGSILTKFGFYRQLSIEVPNIKFHENPSTGSRTDTYGQTDTQADGRTDGRTAEHG